MCAAFPWGTIQPLLSSGNRMEDRNPYAALAGLSDDLSRLATAIAPNLVSIEAGRRRFATGTVWRDGVVVTTAHAIRDTEHLRVIGASDTPLAATLAGWDLASDLAVLKVEQLTGPDLSVQGDRRAINSGELVVALAGSSKEPVTRLTMVSSVGRLEPFRRGPRRGDVIELDLAPFPGFSGGPLVDSRGRIVAINTAGFARGVALALPLDLVSPVIDELLTRGRIARGYLGIGVHPVRLPGAEQDRRGLLVHSLEAGGPAEQAGVLVGDILVSIQGRSLDTPLRLLEELGGERVGESVRLGVIRGGNSIEISAVVGERPQRTAGRRCHGR
jgi:S1-C subfamily serine protease